MIYLNQAVIHLRKPKIYLDTSVVSFYYAEDSPEKTAITQEFFDYKIPNEEYEIYLSELTLRELGNCSNPELQDKLLKLARSVPHTVLLLTEEVSQVAEQFVEEGFIPSKYQEDATHIAFALVHGLDYIISWNFKHIVRPKTRKAVKVIAAREGFKGIEIITPEEVIADDGEV
jgi:predicted nucleic acid-binding protein